MHKSWRECGKREQSQPAPVHGRIPQGWARVPDLQFLQQTSGKQTGKQESNGAILFDQALVKG